MRLIILLLLFACSYPCCAQRVVPDSTFGTNGVMVDNEDSVRMNSNKMAVQPDGKIIVAGSYFYYLYPQSFDLVWEMSLMRFKPDGSRDSSFNGTGHVKKILEHGTRISALVLQPDGRMLITFNNGTLLRYLPSGVPDSSFNDSGEVKLPFLFTYDYTSGAALQPDGKILITGNVYNSYLLLTRLKQDGTMDSTFGRYGIRNVTIDSVTHISGSAVAVQPDGEIAVTGSSDKGMVVMRFMPNGLPDGSFGAGKGYIRTIFPELANSGASLLSLLPDGKMMIGGTAWATGSSSGTIWIIYWLGRISSSGSFDTSFNGTGRLAIDSTLYTNSFTFLALPSIGIQQDGKILMSTVAGADLYSKRFSLYRINPNGSLDDTFGTRGQIITPISAKSDYAWDVAIQPDKKVLLCGVSNWDTAWPQSRYSAPSVVRYKTLPAPVVPTDTSTGNYIKLYPNPVADNLLKLQYRLIEPADISIQMWNTIGQTIQKWALPAPLPNTIYNEGLLLPGSLPCGNYIIRITAGKMQQTTLIVKQ